MICVVDFFPLTENDVNTSKRPPKKQKNAHKNDTKTHINTLFEETCTRKKPEEHDGFII